MDALDERKISTFAGNRTSGPQLSRLCPVPLLTGLSQILRELSFVNFHVIQVDRNCYEMHYKLIIIITTTQT